MPYVIVDGFELNGSHYPKSDAGINTCFNGALSLGDDWTHLCTVADSRIDPLDTLGIVPDVPLPYWGWGSIPDQYGRRFDGDDGETPLPPDPHLADLPPLRPWRGKTRP